MTAPAGEAPHSPQRRAWITALCLLCALLITYQAWVSRSVMNPDGISYLDMADRLQQGNFDTL